jgi:hypothetical protein
LKKEEEKTRAFLSLRRFKKSSKKAPQRSKTAKRTKQIPGKTGFRQAKIWLCGIIRGLGYSIKEERVKSFFTSAFDYF